MNGLSTRDAGGRLERFGPNALPEHPPELLWRRFVRQFNSPLIFILVFAVAFDTGVWVYEGVRGWPVEASAIALILLFNAVAPGSRALLGSAAAGSAARGRNGAEAGIRVVMITGDHPATALAIAHQIGIPGVRVLTGGELEKHGDERLTDALVDVNVFARVRPEQKLRRVESLRRGIRSSP